jgi:hypothetical protein
MMCRRKGTSGKCSYEGRRSTACLFSLECDMDSNVPAFPTATDPGPSVEDRPWPTNPESLTANASLSSVTAIRTEKKRMPTKDQEDSVIVETDFIELNDGTMLELVEHPDRPGRHCFAVWKSGKAEFCGNYEQNGQIYVFLLLETKTFSDQFAFLAEWRHLDPLNNSCVEWNRSSKSVSPST